MQMRAQPPFCRSAPCAQVAWRAARLTGGARTAGCQPAHPAAARGLCCPAEATCCLSGQVTLTRWCVAVVVQMRDCLRNSPAAALRGAEAGRAESAAAAASESCASASARVPLLRHPSMPPRQAGRDAAQGTGAASAKGIKAFFGRTNAPAEPATGAAGAAKTAGAAQLACASLAPPPRCSSACRRPPSSSTPHRACVLRSARRARRCAARPRRSHAVQGATAQATRRRCRRLTCAGGPCSRACDRR